MDLVEYFVNLRLLVHDVCPYVTQHDLLKGREFLCDSSFGVEERVEFDSVHDVGGFPRVVVLLLEVFGAGGRQETLRGVHGGGREGYGRVEDEEVAGNRAVTVRPDHSLHIV